MAASPVYKYRLPPPLLLTVFPFSVVICPPVVVPALSSLPAIKLTLPEPLLRILAVVRLPCPSVDRTTFPVPACEIVAPDAAANVAVDAAVPLPAATVMLPDAVLVILLLSATPFVPVRLVPATETILLFVVNVPLALKLTLPPVVKLIGVLRVRLPVMVAETLPFPEMALLMVVSVVWVMLKFAPLFRVMLLLPSVPPEFTFNVFPLLMEVVPANVVLAPVSVNAPAPACVRFPAPVNIRFDDTASARSNAKADPVAMLTVDTPNDSVKLDVTDVPSPTWT